MMGGAPPPPPPVVGGGGLTSTTAPGKTFATRSELALHYKSDWHRYNCKRKEANLPLLNETDFTARLEAALAVRREREARESRDGRDHLKKNKKKDKKKKKTTQEHDRASTTTTKEDGREEGGMDVVDHQHGTTITNDSKGGRGVVVRQEEEEEEEDHQSPQTQNKEEEEDEEDDEGQPPPEINPKQCLFDRTNPHSTITENLQYMTSKYSFFIPDVEYIVSKTRFLGYCAEKIHLGHMCLYCQRTFRSGKAVQDHMVTKRHCKVRYEDGVDLWEYEPFYDFSLANEEFERDGGLGGRGGEAGGKKKKKKQLKKKESIIGSSDDVVMVEKEDVKDEDEEEEWVDDDDNDDDESGEWEDISSDDDDDDDNMDDDDDDDDEYSAYEEELLNQGFDVTSRGELIFPDGRIVGHRALHKYYKQKRNPDVTERAAVVAAKRAMGDPAYARFADRNGNHQRGLLVSSDDGGGGDGRTSTTTSNNSNNKAGMVSGRRENGVLIRTDTISGGKGGFTALSLYRYKAVIKKSRRDEFKGRRLQQRTTRNMNRMDKKANRLMNNVSVAHAPR